MGHRLCKRLGDKDIGGKERRSTMLEETRSSVSSEAYQHLQRVLSRKSDIA